MNPGIGNRVRRIVSLALSVWLTTGLVLLGDWVVPADSQARRAAGGARAGVASGPRGSVAYTPRGSVAVGARGGVAAHGPYGGAAVGPRGGVAARGPYGGAAAVGPGGAAAVRGPGGAAAVAGPGGAVVAAPRGTVATLPAPVYPGVRPVPVPVPVAPAYYGRAASGVAAGVALGAMLTVLPATAMAIYGSSGQTIYMVDQQCYQEVHEGGATYYQRIACP